MYVVSVIDFLYKGVFLNFIVVKFIVWILVMFINSVEIKFMFVKSVVI